MRMWIAIVLGTATLSAQAAPELRTALANRVDVAKRGVGMVVGVLTRDSRTFTASGRVSADGPEPSADTLFEIGSVTKVFTALLLADMVERGEVTMDDMIRRHLPDSVTVPSLNGREITLADLATHTAGLPRLPGNLDLSKLENPYAKYGSAQLYEFLSGYTLPRQPGAQWEYSNLGGGLLGHMLARRAGMTYEELLTRRVLEPLGMTNTTISLSAAQRARMATPHDDHLRPVPLWDFDALAGAGAIRSTASDMLSFAAAALGLFDTPLRKAFDRMRELRKAGASPAGEQAAGWAVLMPFDSEILIHDGGTGGFRSALAVDRTQRRAVVVWVNSTLSVVDVALSALDSRIPLQTLPAARTEILLSEAILGTYVGAYALAPGVVVTITRVGQRLFAQPTNQTVLEIFAEKEGEFFAKDVDARITFTKNSDGAVIGLVLQRSGRSVPAPRQR